MGTYSSELQFFRVFYFEGGRLFQALHPNLGTVLFDTAGAALPSVCEGGLRNRFKSLKLFPAKITPCLVANCTTSDPKAYVQTQDPALGCCLILTAW